MSHLTLGPLGLGWVSSHSRPMVVDLVNKSHWAYHLLHLGVPAVLEVALS